MIEEVREGMIVCMYKLKFKFSNFLILNIPHQTYYLVKNKVRPVSAWGGGGKGGNADGIYDLGSGGGGGVLPRAMPFTPLS